jgi:hypothetical protein
VSMMKPVLSSLLVVGLVAASAGTSRAITPAERCEAYQLAASGQRISAKLHCRAWAKLTGTPVDAACLDKAEKRFLIQLQEGGPDCAEPSDVVSLGAAADAQSNAVVADVQPDAPAIPSATGHWQSRSSIINTPSGGAWVDCENYPPGQCPQPDVFLIIDCDTQLTQTGSKLEYVSTCSTPPESPLQRATFPQEATGSVDLVTGEWMLSGTVEIPGLDPIDYSGEGSTSPDGRTSTGFTTAGFSASGVKTEWLASTVSHRVD